jgi:hypothetical protein
MAEPTNQQEGDIIGGSMFLGATGAPIVSPSPGQYADTVMPPSPAPSAAPTGMDAVLSGMDPKQRAIYDMMLQSEQEEARRRQAAGAAQAGVAARTAGDIREYLATPKPPIYEPKYKAMPTPPKPQYRDPIEAIGSPLAGLALVAGLFTRTSGTATLNAAAAAMQAQQQGDQLAFENARLEFRDKLDETLRSNEQEHRAYTDSWNNRKLTMQDRLADLEMKATLYKNEGLAASARAGNVSDVQMRLNALVKAQEVIKALQPPASSFKQEQVLFNEGHQWALEKAKAEGRENDAPYVAELRKQYINEATPTAGKGGNRGLSLDDRIKLDQARADLAAGRDEAKARRRIEELEAKARLQESLQERRAEQQKELQEARQKAQQEGKLVEFERKAEFMAEQNRLRAEEANKRLDIKINADKEKAAAKDAKLSGKVGDTLKETVQAVKEMEAAQASFQDSYAGHFFDSLGQLNQWLGSRGKGGSPEALWWANKEFLLTMPLRHALFGATLTGGEKESWRATDITPGMSPDQIRLWFGSRIAVAREKLNDQINTLRAKGVSDDNIRIVVGSLMPGGGAGSSEQNNLLEQFGLTPKPGR